ncbi:MAG: leucine-rich repeat domain-containing protein, partial [Verrucomicrobiaceae bacterium]
MRTPRPLSTIILFFSVLSLPLLAQQSGDFTYSSSAGAVTITRYTGAGGAVNIPENIAGQPVRKIGFQAFFRCFNVTSVTLPDTVTALEHNAFIECSGLTNVTFSNNLTSIGQSAFGLCTSLVHVTFPSSLTSIGEYAFSEATGLKTATFLGNAPTTFGPGVFNLAAPGFTVYHLAGKTGFTSPLWEGYPTLPIEFTYTINSGSVTITGYTGAGGHVVVPPTITGLPVTQINPEAFHAGIRPDNNSITGITFPDTVTYIGWGAFAGCSGLTSVGFGSGLATIDYSAFYGCTGLTAITIPASVTNVESAAFGLTGLTEATFVGNAPATFGDSVFHSTPSGFTVYYYDGRTGFSSPTWKSYPAVKLGGTHGSIEAWRSRHFGTTANSGTAADNADPDGDGVSNLVEFAFNTNPRNGSNVIHTSPAGIKGLPLTSVVNQNGNLILKTEFVRRKSSANLSYTVQYSDSLASATWITVPNASIITPIDSDWERVV